MRNLKRFLAMALSVLMVAGSFAAVSAKEFTDVEAGDDYAVAIDKLSDLGVIQGKDDDSYAPAEELTRWHMALFLARLDSGRMEDEDTLRLWYEATNYTPFADLAGDYPVAAINYVYNYDMIVGTSATTFSPDAGIMYQDALTMVVRALDYGSEAMDAGYPWKYINKANELGLTDGIDASVLYTDTLNRGEMAQVLYNALYAVDAEGNTYAEKYMGQTTVIVTGIKGYQIAPVEKVQLDGYVSVNVMNANGTINADVTYFLPVAEFGAYEDIVGMTFRVNTSDNFQTLDIAEPCEFDVVKTENFVPGAPDNAGFSNKLTVEGTDYKVVDSYSFLYNNQNTTSVGTSKDGSNELLLFGYQATDVDGDEAADFNYDANGNILNAKGEIVAYYVPAITGSYEAPYAAKLADGVYKPFTTYQYVDEDGDTVISTWKSQIAALVGTFGMYNAEYGSIYNTRFIASTNRFAELKAYDDDVDGLYERAFYNYWCFGRALNDANGVLRIEGSNAITSTVVDADGNAVAVKHGDYVRYTKDAITGKVIVDKIYAWNTVGKVIGVDGFSFTTENGTYNATGIANYPGATAKIPAYPFFGYTVKVITEFDSNGNEIVLLVEKVSTIDTIVVFDNIVAINNNGYVKGTMYDLNSGATTIADIATVNGYEYSEYVMLQYAQSLESAYAPLQSGTVWAASKDVTTGLWHLSTAVATVDVLAADAVLGFDQWTTATTNSTSVKADVLSAKKTDDGKDIVLLAKGVKTDGATVIIVRDEDGKFFIKKGNDSMWNVTVTAGRETTMLKSIDTANGRNHIKYLYINNAAETSIDSDYIIYVPYNYSVAVSNKDIIGNKYTYSNILKENGTVGTVEVYNYILEPGKFYQIDNEYVEAVLDEAELDKLPTKVVKSTDAQKVFVIDTAAKTFTTIAKDHTANAFAGYLALASDNKVVETPAPTHDAEIKAAKALIWEALWDVVAATEAGASATEMAILNTKLDNAITTANVTLKEFDKVINKTDLVYLEAKLLMEELADEANPTVKEIEALAALAPEGAAELALAEAVKYDNAAHNDAGNTTTYKKALEYYAMVDPAVKFADAGHTLANTAAADNVADRVAEITEWVLMQTGEITVKEDGAALTALSTGWNIVANMTNLKFSKSVQVLLYAGEELLTTVTNTAKVAPGTYDALSCRIIVTDTTASSSWTQTAWTPDTAKMPTEVVYVVDGYVMDKTAVTANPITMAPIDATAWAVAVGNVNLPNA